jgi:hypothetical protein
VQLGSSRQRKPASALPAAAAAAASSSVAPSRQRRRLKGALGGGASRVTKQEAEAVAEEVTLANKQNFEEVAGTPSASVSVAAPATTLGTDLQPLGTAATSGGFASLSPVRETSREGSTSRSSSASSGATPFDIAPD